MNNADEITDDTGGLAAIRRLARVEPGGRGGEPSGAAGRALLAAITAQEPSPAPAARRRRSLRRPAFGLAVAVGVAAGVIAVPIALRDGAPSSYAVTLDDGTVTIQIRDFDDAAGLERRLKELKVPATVDHVPEGMMCREPRGRLVENIPRGLYSVPENIPGEAEGWQMRINTKLFGPGQTFVWTISGKGGTTTTYLMEGPVAACEPVPAPAPRLVKPEFRVATVEGRSLAGLRVDEKTVGEVLPELHRRGKKVVFAIISVPPGNPGGYGIDRTQDEPVGDGFVVWEAEENAKGVIRLLVTEQRLDRNPVYGGPRDAAFD
ncbi:hypothetical protein Nocox_21800 [Nonomuraea coxensis DSM 45129]|uniref:Uncharacterized protein n=2 Tax=Nonomuraea coxensis TaxID=404386 RepID=A0ABX8U4B4_9ACTN|nr:hypothetical protein Nocox_21800 [Nonomuraea coxensis DSM 45129]